MGIKNLILLAAASQLATAHFGLEYPNWRADTLDENSTYSQWDYPCGGVKPASGNRTDWPTTGGSLILDLHHPWTYVFVNLGLGDNVTNFNYTLTPSFWNETGKGTLCVPHLPLPAGLSPADGAHGSIQVITLGESGSALYNCADIVFRANASNLSGDSCKNSTGLSIFSVADQTNSSAAGGNSSANGTTAGGKNAGAVAGVNVVALTSVVALAVAFVAGGL